MNNFTIQLEYLNENSNLTLEEMKIQLDEASAGILNAVGIFVPGVLMTVSAFLFAWSKSHAPMILGTGGAISGVVDYAAKSDLGAIGLSVIALSALVGMGILSYRIVVKILDYVKMKGAKKQLDKLVNNKQFISKIKAANINPEKLTKADVTKIANAYKESVK